jgi:signal peptidase II
MSMNVISRAWLRSFYISVSAILIVLDRLTKIYIRNHIALYIGSRTVIHGFFSITHVENNGAAFSLFADWPQRVRVPLLIGFSTCAMLVVGYLLWSSARRFTWSGLALAFILGGAVGNLYDRIRYGRVTDFLHFYVGQHSWPDFNVADSAIVTGAILLALTLLFGSSHHSSHQG